MRELTGLEKASILLIAMGTKLTAEVFKHLKEPEIERLSAQIMKMREVEPAMIQSVLMEFASAANADASTMGGKDFAMQVLEQVIGQEKASKLLDKAAMDYRQPFESLWDVDATRLGRVLCQEHPQVIALVLTYLPSDKAAVVLTAMSDELQAEVAHRICVMSDADTEILMSIEDSLKAKLAATANQVVSTAGPKTLVEILNNAERTTERNVLGALQDQDPEIGEQVRSMMFVFEDLPKLEDRAVQLILREIDQEDLRLALKGASEEIRTLIFRNMSERAAEMLKEDLEMIGSVRAKEIEAAQQRVISIVRNLLNSGEATLKSQEEGAEVSDGGSGGSEWEDMMKQFESEDGGDVNASATQEDQSGESADQIDKAA